MGRSAASRTLPAWKRVYSRWACSAAADLLPRSERTSAFGRASGDGSTCIDGLPLRLGQEERLYRQMVAKPIVVGRDHNYSQLFRGASDQLAARGASPTCPSNAGNSASNW